MKHTLLALALMTLIFGCSKDEEKTKNYIPRALTKNESFNFSSDKKSDSVTIYKLNKPEQAEWLSVKFGDSTVSIQTDPKDPKKATNHFTFAEFVNTQKTCVLVQIEDETALVAPSFLISLKEEGGLQVVSLSRPTKEGPGEKSGLGISRLGRTGHLVDNDFFITSVTAKAYLLKRQDPEQRIDGKFLILSPDRQTIVFATPKSLYQVNYISNETSTLPLPANLPTDLPTVYNWVQKSYSFQKSKQGISFLTNREDDKIVDISEFKK
ncbi:hypothetical protein [Pedobacter gandavensis]|uniref:Uncharacterized protein n=1 Tax=Pedobacter gandavensis TaxID=2679963 RepID=A0ABR6F233_9SPHI|nr:hypothetical protein [Pedobacter gandavensis]MBB2151552.1 hypothetical protein [Pedobacter gandavensis]